MVWRAELGSIRERDLIWLLTGTNACAMRPGCARVDQIMKCVAAHGSSLPLAYCMGFARGKAAYFVRCAACSTVRITRKGVAARSARNTHHPQPRSQQFSTFLR